MFYCKEVLYVGKIGHPHVIHTSTSSDGNTDDDLIEALGNSLSSDDKVFP